MVSDQQVSYARPLDLSRLLRRANMSIARSSSWAFCGTWLECGRTARQLRQGILSLDRPQRHRVPECCAV